jgi:hypothetical protein
LEIFSQMFLAASSFLEGRPCLSLLLVVWWLFVSLGATTPVAAQEASASQVKAAFLYNFAKFVEWPPAAFAAAPGNITLGILEREPMAAALEALQGKEVQGRKLVVKRCRNLEELKNSQIFFASAAGKPGLREIMAALRGLPVLTVTDEVDDFARLGVIINLTRLDDKIRFGIDMPNAKRCGLKISSQLLKLALRTGR